MISWCFFWRTFPAAGSSNSEERDEVCHKGVSHEPVAWGVICKHISAFPLSACIFMHVHILTFPPLMVDDLQEHGEEMAPQQAVYELCDLGFLRVVYFPWAAKVSTTFKASSTCQSRWNTVASWLHRREFPGYPQANPVAIEGKNTFPSHGWCQISELYINLSKPQEEKKKKRYQDAIMSEGLSHKCSGEITQSGREAGLTQNTMSFKRETTRVRVTWRTRRQYWERKGKKLHNLCSFALCKF